MLLWRLELFFRKINQTQLPMLAWWFAWHKCFMAERVVIFNFIPDPVFTTRFFRLGVLLNVSILSALRHHPTSYVDWYERDFWEVLSLKVPEDPIVAALSPIHGWTQWRLCPHSSVLSLTSSTTLRCWSILGHLQWAMSPFSSGMLVK